MSKIYISALGASSYDETTYSHDDNFTCNTRYIQIATMKLWQCKDWLPEEDKIILLVTEKAKKMCLEDHIGRDKNPETGLKTEMVKANIPWSLVEIVHIEEGKNKEEIMDVFMKLNNIVKLHPGAELYYDVTNALRYLPMLLVVFNNYSRFVYGTSCEHIAYGSFQTPVTVDGKECRPIIDLDWLEYIQQWTTAADRYIHSGDSEYLKTLARDDYNLFKRERRTNIPSRLSDLTDDLLTCQGISIISGRQYKKLLDSIQAAKKEHLPSPLIPLMEFIMRGIHYFSPEKTWVNGLYAAKWCLERKMYQQTLTLIQEIGFTYLCICLNLDWTDEDHRKIASNIVHYVSKKVKVYAKEYQLYIDYINKHEQLAEWVKILNSATDSRNQFNHGGMKEKKGGKKKPISSPKALKDKTSELLDRALGIEYKDIDKFVLPELPANTFFINLSNHPSADWNEDQLTAARQLGEVIDVPFPDVHPELTPKDINKQADAIVCQVHQMVIGDTVGTTIHVMGEMTMTYALVKAFKDVGYRCVASTTERKTTNNPDGSKTSIFSFCAFREY